MKLKKIVAIAAAGMMLSALGGVASADERQRAGAPIKGEGEGLKLIDNIPIGTCGVTKSGTGTDHENVEFGKKTYAFVTSRCPAAEGGGVYVIDITNPAKAKVAARIPCVATQGDIQVSYDKKTLLLGHSSAGGPDGCLALGKAGFQLFDISNPVKPKPVGFAQADASHNLTAHPTKPLVYVSLGSLTGVGPNGRIQIWDIKNPAKPELLNTILSQPYAPHDISFNKKGTMAVTAAVSHFDIFDTSDPVNPTLAWTGQCPGCTITHDAKFTPNDKNILIGDEGGGGSAYPCPGGAWYIYDFSTPPVPVLTGIYEPANFITNQEGGVGACTSHVFEISPDSERIAISWYKLGTRYLDISSAIGVAVGSNDTGGIKECGWFVPEQGDSWSSKFSTDARYITSNDINRGFDIYKIENLECE